MHRSWIVAVLALQLSVSVLAQEKPAAPQLDFRSFAKTYSAALDITYRARLDIGRHNPPAANPHEVYREFVVERAEKPKFHWRPALWQSSRFLLVMHAFRLATEPSTRAELKGK